MTGWSIRHADCDDRDAVLQMAHRFLSADGPYGAKFQIDDEKIHGLAERMLQRSRSSLTLIAAHEGEAVGMFGMFLFDHPITGETVAAELCWWMEPEFRGTRLPYRMLQQAESWARASGAQVVEMIAPSERVASFYDRIGYDRTDVHYRKTL